MATAPQPADKIMVSNLPPDVNEAQVKVSNHDAFRVASGFAHDLSLPDRNYSRRLLAPSGKSISTTTAKAAQKVSHPFSSNARATAPRPISSTTTDSLMEVSIGYFHSTHSIFSPAIAALYFSFQTTSPSSLLACIASLFGSSFRDREVCLPNKFCIGYDRLEWKI